MTQQSNSPWQVVSETPAATPQPATQPTQPSSQSADWQVVNNQPVQPQQKPDTGVMASLKRTGSALVHAPGAIWDAFTKPPVDVQEEIASRMPVNGQTLPPSIALGLHRLVIAPSVREWQKADEYQKQATGSTQAPGLKPGFDFGMGDTPQAKAQHLANMHRLAAIFPLIGPIAGDITERYISGDRSGAVTDVLGNMVAPKIMEGAGKLGLAAVNKVAGKVAPAVAEHMYQSSLKPSTTNAAAENVRTVRTGVDSGVPVSEAGLAKLNGLIRDLDSKIEAEIKNNPNAPINKFDVTKNLNAPAQRFAQQVAPAADLQHISEVGNEFLESQPGTITAENAQAIKKGTYQRIGDRAYGEVVSARVEAEKALARGIKQELEKTFPEIKQLNAEQSKYLDLRGALERAVNRAANRQTMAARLGGPAAGVFAGGLTTAFFGHEAGTAVGAAAFVLKTVLDDPAMQSRLAIAISKAGHGIPYEAANFRVQQFVNSLAQAQHGGDDQAAQH
jgi:hypothetical protein